MYTEAQLAVRDRVIEMQRSILAEHDLIGEEEVEDVGEMDQVRRKTIGLCSEYRNFRVFMFQSLVLLTNFSSRFDFKFPSKKYRVPYILGFHISLAHDLQIPAPHSWNH